MNEQKPDGVTVALNAGLAPALLVSLRSFNAEAQKYGYYFPMPTPQLRTLQRNGLVERWNPVVKATGRTKPYRLTAKGRAELDGANAGIQPRPARSAGPSAGMPCSAAQEKD